jgi:hypothetical protein
MGRGRALDIESRRVFSFDVQATLWQLWQSCFAGGRRWKVTVMGHGGG